MNKPSNPTKASTIHPDKEQRVRHIRSQDLFHCHKEVVIEHTGQEYRLRITRQNKLILTK